MINKRIATALAIAMLCVPTTAQTVTMSDVFKQMPDSLLPSLTQNNRLDLVDFVDSKMDADVKNRFDEHSKLTVLTDKFLHLDVSEASTVELRLLPSAETLPDSAEAIVCMVQTFGSDAVESTVEFFTSKWLRLNLDDPLHINVQSLLVRPDTMSVERYNELLNMTDCVTLTAKLSATDETLLVSAVPQLLSREERRNVSTIFMDKTLKWGGIAFK